MTGRSTAKPGTARAEDKRIVACGHVYILPRKPNRQILEVKPMTNQRH